MQGILNIQLPINEYCLMIEFSHLLTTDQNLILGLHICMQSRVCLRVPSSVIETNFSVLRVALPAVRASLVAQMVKNLLAIRETWVWSLGHEDLMEKGMATHTSTLA